MFNSCFYFQQSNNFQTTLYYKATFRKVKKIVKIRRGGGGITFFEMRRGVCSVSQPFLHHAGGMVQKRLRNTASLQGYHQPPL